MADAHTEAAQAAIDLKGRVEALNENSLGLLFGDARSFREWSGEPVPDPLLHQLHNLFIMPPTANNAQPARVFYVKSAKAKERLGLDGAKAEPSQEDSGRRRWGERLPHASGGRRRRRNLRK